MALLIPVISVVGVVMTGLLKRVRVRKHRRLGLSDGENLSGKDRSGPAVEPNWWQIDTLGFDQQFMSMPSLINSALALMGMFVFRRLTDHRHLSRIAAPYADDLGYSEVAVAKRIEGLRKSPPSTVRDRSGGSLRSQSQMGRSRSSFLN